MSNAIETLAACVPDVKRKLASSYDRDAIQDAVQEVLLRVVENPKRLKKVRNYEAFLVTSVRNQIIDSIRRGKAEQRAIERIGMDVRSPSSAGGLKSRPGRVSSLQS